MEQQALSPVTTASLTHCDSIKPPPDVYCTLALPPVVAADGSPTKESCSCQQASPHYLKNI